MSLSLGSLVGFTFQHKSSILYVCKCTVTEQDRSQKAVFKGALH